MLEQLPQANDCSNVFDGRDRTTHRDPSKRDAFEIDLAFARFGYAGDDGRRKFVRQSFGKRDDVARRPPDIHPRDDSSYQ